MIVSPASYGLEQHNEWRPNQLEAVQWIASRNGYIILQAPVGSGKTAIAAALANNSTLTAICRTKGLQVENYDESYGFDAMFGKSNYPCVHPEYSGNADTCAFAEQGMHLCPYANSCPYLLAKAIAMESKKRSLNYAYWLTARWPREMASEMIVLDEAHQLPDITLDWAGVEIGNTAKSEWELNDFPEIIGTFGGSMFAKVENPVDVSIDWIANAINAIENKLSMSKRKFASLLGEKEKQKLMQGENLVRKLTATRNALLRSPHDWYIKSGKAVIRDMRGNFIPRFICKPLSAKYHFPSYFGYGKSTILMSATIGNPDAFATELGIKDKYSFCAVPNQWPAHTRPVFDLGAPKMGHKSTPADYEKQAEVIAHAIQQCPPDWKGVIHVTRKTEAALLAKRLSKYSGLSNRLWTPDTTDGTNIQMEKWKKIKKKNEKTGMIAITWTWAEGVDLREERICISAKCLTPDMQLFGPNGYINIGSVKTGDRVFGIDKNDNIIIDEVIGIIKSHWNGPIHTYNGVRYDLSVTDNHDMLIKRKNKTENKFQKIESRHINSRIFYIPIVPKGWNGIRPQELITFEQFFNPNTIIWYRPINCAKEDIRIPKYFKYYRYNKMWKCQWKDIDNQWNPSPLDQIYFQDRPRCAKIPYFWNTNELIKIIGWFISEGHSFNKLNKSCGIVLTQNQGAILDEMIASLNNLNIPYCKYYKDKTAYQIQISSQILYRAFVNWCGKKSFGKQVPRWALDCNKQILTILFNSLVQGDGSTSVKGSIIYYTSSPNLVNNIIEICLKISYSPTIIGVYNNNFAIGIAQIRNKGFVDAKKHISIRSYNGIVWCVRTKTGTILVSRNGKFAFIGNCPYPSLADDYEIARRNHNGKTYLWRTAVQLEQSLGRTRRGEPEDYDNGSGHEQLVAIADGNWRRVKSYLSNDLMDSIQDWK